MKLFKALKVKNRLAGEVAQLQAILHRENARRNDSKSVVDREQVFRDLASTREKLSAVKSSIARANVGIYGAIEQMAELKAYISWLPSLPVRDGEDVVFVGRDQEKLTYTWESYLKREDIDRLTKETQDKINALQDQIDSYNAVTDIDLA